MAGGSAGPIRGNPFRTGFVQREYLWAFMLVTSLFFLWGTYRSTLLEQVQWLTFFLQVSPMGELSIY